MAVIVDHSTVLDDAGDLFNLGPPSKRTTPCEGRLLSPPLPLCSLGALREAAAAVDLGGMKEEARE